MRDDFSQKTIRTLEKRVNSKCSNPDHRVPTCGPTGTTDSSINIGVAAHICAAAPGGPRFNSNMGAEERSHIENGIWLCQNCASLIDRDTSTYTVELLNRWKLEAETHAKEELGKIPISREEYEIIKSLAFERSFKSTTLDPIAVAAKLLAQSLEKKDPRFKVDVERTHGKTTYTYNARESVACSLTVKDNFEDEFAEKFSALLRNGKDLRISSQAVLLEGSPLFAELQTGDGMLVMSSSTRRHATIVMQISDENKNYGFFAEIPGEIAAGTESMNFHGKGLSNLFALDLDIGYDSKSVHVTTSLDFSIWNKKNILTLPNFDRIWSYYKSALDERLINLSVEIDGNCLAQLRGTIPNKKIENFALLRYVHSSRIISKALNYPIYFNSDAEISWENFDDVNDLRSRIQIAEPRAFKSNPTITLSPPPGGTTKDVVQYIESTKGNLTVEMEHGGLNIFAERLPSFIYSMTLSNARLKQLKKKNKSIVAEIVPLTDCEITCKLKKIE